MLLTCVSCFVDILWTLFASYMDPGCKVQTGKHGFLVFLLKKDLLMVVDDEWWRKRAVVLIDFGQIETLVAFWRWDENMI